MLFNAPCKTGQLQVDESVVSVTALFKKTVWQVPRSAVTRISQQQGGMMTIDLTIHTTQGAFPAHMMTKQNATKFLALFPELEIGVPLGKEWYHDPVALAHVEVYTDEKRLQKEVEQAAQFGWIPQTQSGTDSHINVGRTMTKFVLTGGLGLMTGASRSKDKITITFVRTPEWLARK